MRQSGAAGWVKGFVICLLTVPQAAGLNCSCRAAQASKGNFTENMLQNLILNLPPKIVYPKNLRHKIRGLTYENVSQICCVSRSAECSEGSVYYCAEIVSAFADFRKYTRGLPFMTSALRGVPSKADIVNNLSEGGCVNLQTRRGRGSKKPKILQTSLMGAPPKSGRGEIERDASLAITIIPMKQKECVDCGKKVTNSELMAY